MEWDMMRGVADGLQPVRLLPAFRAGGNLEIRR